MRNALLFSGMVILVSIQSARGQCTYSCSSYALSPINFSMYPVSGNTLSMLDDEITTTLPLHFNFDFYCATYNQVRICSNGFITFDFSNIPFGNTPYAQNIPTVTVPNGVIAWNWNDLDPSQGGSVTYTTVGTSPFQKFIVTYSNVPLWTPTNPPSNLRNTGQIVLHETTNIIEIHVAEANNNGWLWHTEGIEDSSASSGVAVPGRNLTLWTASLSSHMFSPYVTGPSPTVTGDTLLCEGTAAVYSASTVNAAQGYYWSFPPGWAQSGVSAVTSATAGSTGNVSVAAIYTCGNSPPATIAVSVIAAPVVSLVAAAPPTVCSNGVYSIQVSGASSYSVFPGSLTGTGNFTVVPGVNTVYTITGTNDVGCKSIGGPIVSVLVKPSPTISVNSGSTCLGGTFTMEPSGGSNYKFSSVFPIVTPTVAGVHFYSVTSQGTNNCVSSPAVSSVTVWPLPDIQLSLDRTAICARETATITATGAQTYTWMNVTGNSHTVQIQPFLSQHYHLAGSDDHGCTSTATIYVAVSPCTGLGESDAPVLTVVPNPSSGDFRVVGHASFTFELRDVGGRVVACGLATPDKPVLGDKIAPGLYFLVARIENRRQAFRVIIE